MTDLRGGPCTLLNCAVGDEPHVYFPERCRSWEDVAAHARKAGVPEGSTVSFDPGLPPQLWGIVSGMGPDAPVVTNENGASQSAIPTAFATMPLRALWELAKLQKYGDDKYGVANWRGITEHDHIEHALAHVFAYLNGDRSDDHLTHAAWRLMAALEGKLILGEDPQEEKPF